MKKWNVRYTEDGKAFGNEIIEGRSYTDAYIRFEVEHPERIIDEITEIKE